MRNIKLVVEYDGSNFSGWQLQPGRRTVQGEITAALERITREKVDLQVAGRTDAGVHAMGQVANFHTNHCGDPTVLQRSLNGLLRPAISIGEAAVMEPSFHARFSARWRLYRYTILNRPDPSPFLHRYTLHVQRRLDLDAMRHALPCLLGEHDFSSFRSAACQSSTPVRLLFDAAIVSRPPLVHIHFLANAFLHNMIRILTGTLLQIGGGARSPDSMSVLLEARDRCLAGPTVRPHGLFLLAVGYDDRPAFNLEAFPAASIFTCPYDLSIPR